MRIICENPEMPTRQIAEKIGISNGSAYYVLTALIEKGFLKLASKNKKKYKIINSNLDIKQNEKQIIEAIKKLI